MNDRDMISMLVLFPNRKEKEVNLTKSTKQEAIEDMSTQNKLMSQELMSIVNKMDVPEFRRTHLNWLSRNLWIRNSGNPKYERAVEIIKFFLRQGIVKV